MTVIVRSISSTLDQDLQRLWISVELSTGATLKVAFPIAHVSLLFDDAMAKMGYCGDPICGSVVTADSFGKNLFRMLNHPNAQSSRIARNVWNATHARLISDAMHYGSHAHDAVMGSIFSKIASAVKSVAKGASRLEHPGTTALVKTVVAGAEGKDMQQAWKGEVHAAWKDAGTIANAAKTVASSVPGVGTIASVAIGATQAALSGKSLTEIVKAAGVSAIPGGPLAQQIAKAGINTVQAGIEGKNILKSAAQQTVGAVTGLIPDPTARDLVQRVALDVASGKNVLSSAEHAAADAAINLIPDATARDMARKAISGNLNPNSILLELSRSVSNGSASPSAIASLINGSVDNLSRSGSAGTQKLNQAAAELIEVSSNFVPDASARDTIKRAIATRMSGADPKLSASTLSSLLSKVTDPSARSLLSNAVQHTGDPSQLLKSVNPDFVAKLVTLDPTSPLSNAIVEGQNVITAPSGIVAPPRTVKTVAAPGQPPMPASSYFGAIGARDLFNLRQRVRQA